MKPSVLCISLDTLTHQIVPTEGFGIHPFNLEEVPANKFHFINREVVDSVNPESFYHQVGEIFPQILGYIIVRSGNEILSYARKHSGEVRLLGSRSIGFGGHVDIEDAILNTNGSINADATLRRSIVRELEEELELSIDPSDCKYHGIIVDTTNSVGKVHRGLLCVIEVEDKTSVTSTKETQDLQWLSLHDLRADIEMYEPWSQIAINSSLI